MKGIMLLDNNAAIRVPDYEDMKRLIQDAQECEWVEFEELSGNKVVINMSHIIAIEEEDDGRD